MYAPGMGQNAVNDTDPKMEALQIEGFRAMSATEKLWLVDSLSRFVKELALTDVRNRFPDDTEREHILRAASRWLEPELMKQAFGWNVDERGF